MGGCWRVERGGEWMFGEGLVGAGELGGGEGGLGRVLLGRLARWREGGRRMFQLLGRS